MNTSDNNKEQEEYRTLLRNCAEKAIHYVKTDNGYFSMRDSFNELCEISHANKGIDQENTIGRRTLLVQSVCIKAIHALTPYQNERLEQQLKDIASDYPEHRHLHFRR